ncbi:CheY-like receiver domain-containing protein [Belliella baltica DSM 15883]|uniref:CheY-like receiver domain-containing protein n=1 Tax=Belliella baltica (strain DSM 15883 / CIP 108006 / LMG 21964 / BA134) TaxID=866536 RepID=I3Z7B9_BELBD|nr:response regulator [Belliella baltica]AFL85137.1 CheY-like receiver domain-containing protein [Belliella baltica DSM 15883]
MRKIQILLVEDNEGDILLITEALEEGKILHDLQVSKDGHQAISLLTKKGEYKHVATPDIIFLDINLPKKNGHEVLKYIKNDPNLKQIPVIMLTTSSTPKDVLEAYRAHANCYITKPVGGSDFLSIISQIEEFWFSIVKLPTTT